MLENRCLSCGFYFGIKAARLEGDEHGYPGMNTDGGDCSAKRIPTIRAIPFFLSCHPCSPCSIAACLDIARLDRDEHGYARMNTGYGRLLREANSYHPCHPLFLVVS